MTRNHLFMSLMGLGMSALATMNNPATDWLHTAKLGAFMHFLPGKDTFALVDSFDVEAVANQLKTAGARYFCFTLGQNSGYMNAPNPVYDSIAGYQPGERCAKRDLPMELALACRKRGIRFMLYLPCQTPNQDLKAIQAFGFPTEKENTDRPITDAGRQNWAKVIEWWSIHYGDLVSGWWFDGGYTWLGFNNDTAALYATAAKKGNPAAIVTFNPGVSFKRATDAEDYTSGELNEPFKTDVTQRWIDGSQAHILTFLGDMWGKTNCRYLDCVWIAWLKHVFTAGCAVTIDMGPNYNPAVAPVGTFSPSQIEQFQRLAQGAL